MGRENVCMVAVEMSIGRIVLRMFFGLYKAKIFSLIFLTK